MAADDNNWVIDGSSGRAQLAKEWQATACKPLRDNFCELPWITISA